MRHFPHDIKMAIQSTLIPMHPPLINKTFQPNWLFCLLSCHGITSNGSILPWLRFTIVLACACDQIACDMHNEDFTLIFKLIFFSNFINEGVCLFLTVYNRKKTRRLAETLYSRVKEEDKCFIKRQEKIHFILLLIFFISLFITLTSVDAFRPNHVNYLLLMGVKKSPSIFWITLILFKILVTLYISTLYISGFVYVESFICLSLDRLNRIEMLKQLVPHENQLIMQELIRMERKFKHFENNSSLAVFQMIAGHFFEITIFLHRQITYDASSLVIRISSLCLTLGNLVLIFYAIAIISHYQEQVTDAGESLIDLFFTQRFTSHEYTFLLILIDKVTNVTQQCMTVWRIVKINRKLIIALYSSFLTIAVLLVQMGNGSLNTGLTLVNTSTIDQVTNNFTHPHT